MDQHKCITCGGSTEGYKCTMCGDEAAEHDEAHGCGGPQCQPKCNACDEAESKCSCDVA